MAAKRGRRPGFVMPEAHRLKIAKSNILSRLIACAEGKIEMSPTQAQVGLGLMRKVLSDLGSVAHTGEDGGPVKAEFTIISGVPRAND